MTKQLHSEDAKKSASPSNTSGLKARLVMKQGKTQVMKQGKTQASHRLGIKTASQRSKQRPKPVKQDRGKRQLALWTERHGHHAVVFSVASNWKVCPVRESIPALEESILASKRTIEALMKHHGYDGRVVVLHALLKTSGFKTLQTFNLLKTR